jgi:hypothetical protein
MSLARKPARDALRALDFGVVQADAAALVGASRRQ